ncbi:MAG: DUF433 domain-containing protein [Anaerolineae bacterium]|nr:DUF433 domain-containing protein [Anaerolineae bacterium]
MIQTPLFEPVPLVMTPEGVLRVGKTRVTLDTVIYTYREGATPEEIVLRYDTLELADVHAVIAYYLRHETEVNAYLEASEKQAEAVRAEVETQQNMSEFWNRLRERRKSNE